MAEKHVDVAVVGGGIGGLAAALALATNGLEVMVLEQAPALAEVGAGVMLSPNSLRLLRRWGVGPAVDAVAAPIQIESFYRRSDGTPVTRLVTADSNGTITCAGIHRADLLGVFAAALPENVVVQTNKRVTDINSTENVARLAFEDGSDAVTANLVVGADGIQSRVQHFVVSPSTPVNSGVVAYRGLLSTEQLADSYNLATTCSVWMGDGKHFLTFPVRSGRLVNYVAFLPSVESAAESWSAEGDPRLLQEAFEGWDPIVVKLLSLIGRTHWWGIYDREPLSRWVRGRVTLLGDAAHAMQPHMGQGANQAIEDAAALALLLHHYGPKNVNDATATYEALRMEHTARVQGGSRAQAKRTDSAYDDLSRRDADLAAGLSFRQFIYDYDVEEQVHAYLGRQGRSAL